MKKFVCYSIFAGVISGCLFRDLCCGPFFGLLWGLILGVPVSLIAVILLRILKKEDSKVANRICSLACASIVVATICFFYKTPSTTIFKRNLANPIPPSVKNIEASTRYVFLDFSHVLRFDINKDDLNGIIKAKRFTRIDDPEFNERGLTSEMGIRSMPYDIPWFTVRSVDNPVVYTSSVPDSAVEYLIYDNKNNVAYYLLLTF